MPPMPMLKQKSKCETALHLALMKTAPMRYQGVIEYSLQMQASQDGLFDWSHEWQNFHYKK